MTAQEYLDNDLQGTHQTYDETGVTLITYIEHSEICRIMEDFARKKMTELMEDKIILQNDGEHLLLTPFCELDVIEQVLPKQ